MLELVVDDLTVKYDSSGFGFPHQSRAVTSYAIRKILKMLTERQSIDVSVRKPSSPVAEYEGLIWTPWYITSTTVTPSALSDRIQLRSVPLWDVNQWDNYGLQGSYPDNWDKLGSSFHARLALLRRIYPSLSDLRVLDVGCGSGASMLNFALHGMDVYGIEIDPNMINHVPDFLLQRIVWADALYGLYAWGRETFDVAFIGCLGYVMSSDLGKLLTDLWGTLKQGSPVILDLPRNAQEVSVADKVAYGPYIRPSQTYRGVLNQSGFTYTDTVSGLLIATKTHTPFYS